MSKKIEAIINNLPTIIKPYYFECVQNNKNDNSILQYLLELQRFTAWFKKYDFNSDGFKQITVEDLENYFNNMSVSGITKASRWSALNSFFDYLVKINHLIINPVAKINRPNTYKIKNSFVENNVLSADEVYKIFNAIKSVEDEWFKNRDMSIFYIILLYGLKVSNIVDLNEQDYDPFECLSSNCLINKHNKHIGTENEYAQYYLDEWITIKEEIDSNALFISQKNNRISGDAINDILKKYALSCGINKKVNVEELRKCFAKMYLSANYSVNFIKEYLGHEESVETYKFLDEIQQKPNEIIKNEQTLNLLLYNTKKPIKADGLLKKIKDLRSLLEEATKESFCQGIYKEIVLSCSYLNDVYKHIKNNKNS